MAWVPWPNQEIALVMRVSLMQFELQMLMWPREALVLPAVKQLASLPCLVYHKQTIKVVWNGVICGRAWRPIGLLSGQLRVLKDTIPTIPLEVDHAHMMMLKH